MCNSNEPLYWVRILLHISWGQRAITFKKTIRLHFRPTEELRLYTTGKIATLGPFREVGFDLEQNVFICHQNLYHMQTEKELEELLTSLPAEGWKRQ